MGDVLWKPRSRGFSTAPVLDDELTSERRYRFAWSTRCKGTGWRASRRDDRLDSKRQDVCGASAGVSAEAGGAGGVGTATTVGAGAGAAFLATFFGAAALTFAFGLAAEEFFTAFFGAAALTFAFGFILAVEAFLTDFLGAAFLAAALGLAFGLLLFLAVELFLTAIAVTSFQDMFACI